jgi:hypothetical protein
MASNRPVIGETATIEGVPVTIRELISPHPFHAHVWRVRLDIGYFMVQRTAMGWQVVRFLRDLVEAPP